MALPLAPMSRLGLTTPLTYAERDFGAAETPAQNVSDFQFFNEAASWHRDLAAAADAEHFMTGVHDALRISRAKLNVRWNGVTGVGAAYAAHGDYSYDQDLSGGTTEDSTAFAATRTGPGLIQVTLAHPLASLNLRVFCMTPAFKYFDAFGTHVYVWKRARVWLYNVASTTVFTLIRKEWSAENFAAAAVADGPCVFQVFCA